MGQTSKTYYSRKVKKESYLKTLKDPELLRTQHKKIAEALKDGPLTRYGISEKTGILFHVVCPRVNEMVEHDILIQTSLKAHNGSTKRDNSVVKLNPVFFEGQAKLI